MQTNNGAEYYWAAAGAHSHYVPIQRIDGTPFVYNKDAADKIKGGNICLAF